MVQRFKDVKKAAQTEEATNLQLASEVHLDGGAMDFKLLNDMSFKLSPNGYGDAVRAVKVFQNDLIQTGNPYTDRYSVTVNFIVDRPKEHMLA